MHARLSADTDLIRAYGSTAAGHAADLDAVAARLSAVSAPTLGPVGARFQAALVRAAEREAGVVADLGGSLAAARTAATGTARAYEVTDADAGARLTGRW